MAFCDKCGAYLPDGHTKCLACGYDSTEAERAKAEQDAAQKKEEKKGTEKYYSFSNKELREKLEEQRRKQQEASKRWAEQEKERRRESQTGTHNDYHYDESAVNNESNKERSKETAAWKNRKLFSILSYLGFLFVLPFIFCKDDQFALYHAKQGAVLFLYGIVCRLLSVVPVVGAVARMFHIYCLVMGISNALKGRMRPLPYIGQLGERF